MTKEAEGMKKLMVMAAVVVAVGLLGTVSYAAWQGRGPAGQVDVNAFRQFQKETLPLRDEMMAKGLELRNEYAKDKPDQDQITKLRAEIGDLRTKIQVAAEKQGLPAWGNGPGAGRGFGRRMMGGAGCGFGGGPGAGGPGCAQGDCPRQ
jgi:zinc resistance-associated protein